MIKNGRRWSKSNITKAPDYVSKIDYQNLKFPAAPSGLWQLSLRLLNVEFPLLQVLRSVMSCIVPPILVKPHFMFDGSVCRIHITATVVSLSSSRVPLSRVGFLRAKMLPFPFFPSKHESFQGRKSALPYPIRPHDGESKIRAESGTVHQPKNQ